jgi:polygalacturonase
VTASVEEFGAVGDGATPNTAAFRRAVAELDSRAGGGGARLEVPPGRWLTGSFNLTSRFTLFLHRGAVILGSQVTDSFISCAILLLFDSIRVLSFLIR